MFHEMEQKNIFQQAKSYAFDYAGKALQRNVFPTDEAVIRISICSWATYRARHHAVGKGIRMRQGKSQTTHKIKVWSQPVDSQPLRY